ncbi:hypothetical protein GX51_01502 [Blastomyces parvus]|uniref:Uncharacterized protein n=1 Tax=Blastomyces parvus TaxID=2060905 RepID=A0A2B7XGL3_9EURO|nr:hypothetical protein GX51_01502 [Blastomyces parvus]
MDVDTNVGSDIEWSHLEAIDEEMVTASSFNNSGNHDSYSMGKNVISDKDSLMTDAVDGRNEGWYWTQRRGQFVCSYVGIQ